MSCVVSKYPNAPFPFLTNKALEAQTLGYMVCLCVGWIIQANVYLVPSYLCKSILFVSKFFIMSLFKMRNSAVSKTTQCVWIISIPHAIYLCLELLHPSLKFILFSFLIINYEIQWLKELAIFTTYEYA